GSLTFKNAPNLTRCAIGLPLDRILIETDSPYMSPVPLRGRRNEPANVLYVCQKLAELKEISPEEAAQQTYLNALMAFDIGG
ncbi:MAG: TatD family hydrolase, partial [Clostridia bacterium]|nr:TatD family hydrolase [Clostridia bacterium]